MSLSSGNADSVSNDELEFRGIGELAFFAVAFLAWEWAVPGEANLTALSPQPFWIPVILLSAKYGTTSGLIAAGLAVALSIATGLPEQVADEFFYAYMLRVAYEPMLWTVAAVVIGHIQDGHRRRQKALTHLIADADLQRINIADNNKELTLHITDLERDLATIEDTSFEAGLHRLSRLRSATGGDQIAHSLQEALRYLTKSGRYSVYLNTDDGFVRDAQLSSREQQNETDIKKINGAAAHSLRAGRVLSVFEGEDPDLLDGIGVFASPIVQPSDGAVLGAIVLEIVEIDALEPDTALGLSFVCDCLAEAMGTPLAARRVSAA